MLGDSGGICCYWGLPCPHGTDHHRKGPGHGLLTSYCNTGEPQSSSADTRCVNSLNSVPYTSTKVSKAPRQRDVPSLSCRHSSQGKQGQRDTPETHDLCPTHWSKLLRVCKELEPAGHSECRNIWARLYRETWRSGPEKGCELWIWRVRVHQEGTGDWGQEPSKQRQQKAANQDCGRVPSSTAHIWTPGTSQGSTSFVLWVCETEGPHILSIL